MLALPRQVLCNPEHKRIERGSHVKLSARNQLAVTVTGVELGTIMSEITVDIGGQTVVAAITRGGAEELALAEGDQVTVLIKATEVMLAEDG